MRLVRRLLYLVHLRRHEAELADELAFHEEQLRGAHESGGLEPRVAAAAGRRAMGKVTAMREDSRAVWVWPWLESAMQDITYALRGLRRQPGFSIVAIATLGIAIGLNTSVFTAFNGVFWRPWPISDPSTVFEVTTIREGRERHGDYLLAEYRDIAARARTVSGLVGVDCAGGYFPGCDIWLDAAVLRPAYVSANAFAVFGVPMAHGRGFRPEEDRTGGPAAVVVLSYDLWQRRFAGDSTIVGRQLPLDGIAFTVVGVAARDLAGISILKTDLWLPLASMPLLRKRHIESRGPGLQLIARLAPGDSRERSRAELEALTRAWRAAQPGATPGLGEARVNLAATNLDPNPVKRRAGYALFGLLLFGSGLVLLLACANLANLHLARAAARGREIAVRVSLGATRRRVIRQLLTESLVMAGAGAAVGVAIAYVAPAYLLRLVVSDSLSSAPVPDLTVFGYSAILAFVTCLAFGLAPALHAAGASRADALKGRYGLAGVNLSLRRAFLTVQVAVSVVVLCGAGFLTRGLARASDQDFGFSVAGVTGFSVQLPGSQDSAATATFARNFAAGLATRPDGASIGATTILPLGERDQTLVIKPGQDSAGAKSIFTLGVSSPYFAVLGIPLRAGRLFVEGDAGRGAIVVNEMTARVLWPGQSPIGQSLLIRTPREVVGVVKDADTEGKAFQEGAVLPKIYEPVGSTSGVIVPNVVVRNASAQTIREITDLAKRLEPAVRVTPAPLAERLTGRLDESRQIALLTALLGGVALVLVSIGIFGVFAYVVQQRTREIGIRIALGAGSATVVRVIIGSSARAIVMGLAAGLAAAFGEASLLRRFIYGVSPLDAVTYAVIIAMLGVAALAAVYIPARRAARISPVIALRAD
jgi:putative ABC transport system permease protein